MKPFPKLLLSTITVLSMLLFHVPLVEALQEQTFTVTEYDIQNVITENNAYEVKNHHQG
jgi:hypothetical protein